MRTTLISRLILLVLGGALVTPDTAQPSDNVKECPTAHPGSVEYCPPELAGSLTPEFLSDLFASLPIPNFVMALFGAPIR